MQFEPPEPQIGYQNGSQIPASEQMFRLLVSSVKDYAIFLLSPEGRILTWNEGAQRAKGYTADEVIGKHFSMFYTQDAKDSGHADNELRIAAKQGRYEEEGWRVRKDGSMFWANVVITALFQDGKLVGFAKVTRDLSERRKAEIEREEALAALAKTNDDLQRLSYVISHELQAPIANISRYSGLLSVRYKDKLGGDAADFISKITESTSLIARMVDDLWTYARISRPIVAHERVYMANILNDALEELKDLGDAEITHGELASVYADKRQMVYLLKELVLNAIKYRRDGEPPRIHVDAREENGRWVFSVRDNGVGIDETHQQDVFTLFHRLRGNLESGATGMGLAIAKRIVQQHGGEIWFESKLGEGTTFYFSIPDSTAREHH